jgi:hypothetical protein
MTMTREKEPINGLDSTEDHQEPEAEENEEPEDEVGGDAPGIGRLIHMLYPHVIHLHRTGEVKKKKKKKKSKKKKLEQSDPPRIGLSKFFPDGIYPEGEIQPYKDECIFFLTRPLQFDIHTLLFLVTRGERLPKRSATRKSWRMRTLKRRTRVSDEGQKCIDSSDSMHGNTSGLE